MATTIDRQGVRGNGASSAAAGPQFRLDPPNTRRTRLPELALGLAMMIGFALTAVLWHMNSTEKQPALALSRSVDRGQVIEAADLRIVYLASDDRIAHLGKDEAATVIGRIAVSDLPKGILVTRANVADRVVLGAEEGVVGLALDPGQVPAPVLVPGDLVNVVAGGPGGESSPPGAAAANEVLASGATVFAIETLGTQGRKFVSLKLPEADANRVAAAAQRGPVRLVLVGR